MKLYRPPGPVVPYINGTTQRLFFCMWFLQSLCVLQVLREVVSGPFSDCIAFHGQLVSQITLLPFDGQLVVSSLGQ